MKRYLNYRFVLRALVPAAMFPALATVLGAQDAKPIWIDVPYVHQAREACGDAALAMVIGYWTEREGLAGGWSDGTPAQRQQAAAQRIVYIIQRDLPPQRNGIPPKAMQKYLEEHSYIVFTLDGAWRDLEREIAKGRPLIAAVRPNGDPQPHYVVIVGVDPVRSLVIMNDPAQRKLLAEERAEFEKDWSAAHNWLLLAVPEMSRLPETAQR